MRKMPTQMGTTGNDGGTEGLSEVQKPVLEHAAPKAGQEEGVAGKIGGVKDDGGLMGGVWFYTYLHRGDKKPIKLREAGPFYNGEKPNWLVPRKNRDF